MCHGKFSKKTLKEKLDKLNKQIKELTEKEIMNLNLVGTESYPNFIVSSKSYKADNSWFADDIEYLLDNSLNISVYSDEQINHLTYIYLATIPFRVPTKLR